MLQACFWAGLLALVHGSNVDLDVKVVSEVVSNLGMLGNPAEQFRVSIESLNENETSLSGKTVAAGAPFAIAGGTGYAISALIVSYATWAVEAHTMSAFTSNLYQFGAFALLCISGLSVTASYQLAPSVPLMNSFVYSVNLGLNMIFQIAFRLSVYTKNMRCGTILFALAAIQLSQLAPKPFDPKLEQLWQVSAIIWHVIFVLVWGWSLITVMRTKDWHRRSPMKVFAWAVFIAGWGSFTDNWAKINGMYEAGSPTWWSILIPYLGVSMFVMFLSVRAMAATDVALYVPTNLCSQLFMNTVSGMAIWHEYKYVDHLVGYLAGYVVCILSVYISTEDADLVASYSNSREISTHSLSQGHAITSFGESLVTLANQWQEQDHVEKADLETRRGAIADALTAGAQTNVFGTKELVDLALRLWQRINPNYMPVGTVVSWMKMTPFFQDYLLADPTFESKLTGPLSQEERNAMTEDLTALQALQVELQNMS